MNDLLLAQDRQLTVNIALALICLCHEQVRYVPSNVVLIADGIATEDLLQSGTLSVY